MGGEADWWHCDFCQSLNNLSARRCYSCRKRKPKEASRASQLLGYRPVISWDGKVRLEMRVPPVTSAGIERPAAVTKPPPLREPPRRSTLEVAPSPPQGARICYRVVEPPPVTRTPPPAGPPPRLVAVPIQPDPYAGPPGPTGGFVPSSILPSQPPPVARPPTSPGTPGRSDELQPVDILHVGPWPHWRDLLDISAPDADRLRDTHSSVVLSSGSGPGVGEPVSGSGLAVAMKSALSKRAEGSVGTIEWPRSDLAAQDPPSHDEGSVGTIEWPRSDLAAQDPPSHDG
jgi:hypothetical protein